MKTGKNNLLNNKGGADNESFIGFEDHGDGVWVRNIRVRILDQIYYSLVRS